MSIGEKVLLVLKAICKAIAYVFLGIFFFIAALVKPYMGK